MKRNFKIYLLAAAMLLSALTIIAFAVNKNEISADYKNTADMTSVKETENDDCCAGIEEEMKAGKIASAAQTQDEEKSCCPEDMGGEAFSENSIYQLDQQWNDEQGSIKSLSDMKGSKIVLSMIFASCTYACPIIINDIKKVESALSDQEKKNVRFVLVSIDPERDSPAVLKDYAHRWNLDLNRWELLTGKKEDIRELAALFGFKYKKDEKGDYSHSNLINVLNKEGEIAFRHEGLNKDVSDIVAQLRKLR